MAAVSASAPGKIILFGEHAVVYGQPAIAAPLSDLRSRVVVEADVKGKPGDIFIHAPDIDVSVELTALEEFHSFRIGVQLVLDELGIERMPACRITISSTIPVASGLGSSASVSAALIRAVSKFLGHPLKTDIVNSLAYEMEKMHHGTPSGVDNTVVVYEAPVYFIRGRGVERFRLQHPLQLLVADTGVQASTAKVVGDVREHWEAESDKYDEIFHQIGKISRKARKLLESSKGRKKIGRLMNDNQELLVEMGVSCEKLDRMIAAARDAGALGAKLSGGGRGGNMIALVSEETAAQVEKALYTAGAKNVISTVLEPAYD